MHGQLGFRSKRWSILMLMLLSRVFFLARIVAAQLWIRLPDTLVNSCYRHELLSAFFSHSVNMSYTKPFVRMFCLTILSVWKTVRANSWLAVWNLNPCTRIKGRTLGMHRKIPTCAEECSKPNFVIWYATDMDSLWIYFTTCIHTNFAQHVLKK